MPICHQNCLFEHNGEMADPDCEELQSTKEYRSSGLPIERFARMLNYNASCVPALSYQSTQTHAIAESSDRFEGTGSDSCRWADDEACDEPGLCAVGTDETDCATRDWIPGHDAVTSTDAWWIDRCPPDSPTCDDDAGVWTVSGLKSRPEVCGDPWTARPQCLRDAGRPWDDYWQAKYLRKIWNPVPGSAASARTKTRHTKRVGHGGSWPAKLRSRFSFSWCTTLSSPSVHMTLAPRWISAAAVTPKPEPSSMLGGKL